MGPQTRVVPFFLPGRQMTGNHYAINMSLVDAILYAGGAYQPYPMCMLVLFKIALLAPAVYGHFGKCSTCVDTQNGQKQLPDTRYDIEVIYSLMKKHHGYEQPPELLLSLNMCSVWWEA